MQKNIAGQKWTVFAFNVTTNIPVTGDAANITADIRLDGGTANPIDDTNPTEMERGYYCFDISQAESNADQLTICPVSASSNVVVIGVPGSTWTVSSLIPTTAIPPSTPSPTTDMQGFCLSDLLYQISFEIGQVSGGNVSNSKFPRKFIIQKLNDRLNMFVLLGKNSFIKNGEFGLAILRGDLQKMKNM